MSRAALDYLSQLLDEAPADEVPPGMRAVLWPVARRANRDTATTYSGGWLTRASGLSAGSVRRYLHDAERRGWIRLDLVKGVALRVTFPVVDAVTAAAPPQGRKDENGVWHPGFCGCSDCVDHRATGS